MFSLLHSVSLGLSVSRAPVRRGRVLVRAHPCRPFLVESTPVLAHLLLFNLSLSILSRSSYRLCSHAVPVTWLFSWFSKLAKLASSLGSCSTHIFMAGSKLSHNTVTKIHHSCRTVVSRSTSTSTVPYSSRPPWTNSAKSAWLYPTLMQAAG